MRSSRPSDILNTYGLAALIPLYLINLSSDQITSSVLHILPSYVIQNVTHTFISYNTSSVIYSSSGTQCVSNCFTFQSLLAKN